jgi:hypothetical protein
MPEPDATTQNAASGREPNLSMWNLKTLSKGVLEAPTDRGVVNVWLARDLARCALEANDALLRIAHWPFDVNVTLESDLRAIKEEAQRHATA